MPEPRPKLSKGREITTEFTEEQIQVLARLQTLTGKTRQTIIRDMIDTYSEDYEYLYHKQGEVLTQHVAELRRWRESGTTPSHPKPKQ